MSLKNNSVQFSFHQLSQDSICLLGHTVFILQKVNFYILFEYIRKNYIPCIFLVLDYLHSLHTETMPLTTYSYDYVIMLF